MEKKERNPRPCTPELTRGGTAGQSWQGPAAKNPAAAVALNTGFKGHGLQNKGEKEGDISHEEC